VIAAHCLVNDDVPPYSVAVGVPVRVVRNRIDDARARAEQEARWAEEARQHAERKAANGGSAAPAPSEDDRRAAAVAEETARSAGIAAPVDPSEQSHLPMVARGSGTASARP
jgi:hypothetical protein